MQSKKVKAGLPLLYDFQPKTSVALPRAVKLRVFCPAGGWSPPVSLARPCWRPLSEYKALELDSESRVGRRKLVPRVRDKVCLGAAEEAVCPEQRVV